MSAAISRASIPAGALTVIGAESETLVLPRAASGCAGIVTGLAPATNGLPADIGAMPTVVAAIRATGGLDYSRERARAFADKAMRALDGLPDNEATAALRGLAVHAVERDR